ncbi:MAG: serine/threonine protein kinase, partial [Alphaproteobacteria bacterium]|nr:serine/threonine protein kinase [Alphaproteobacteria bacterium]
MAPAKIEPGDILGHTYEIEALLARGGMGEVYRARHIELGSIHAIKVILPDLTSDPRMVAMFKEEAKKLRKVRDDAIVAYEGLFRDEFGRRYLVMEYVDGVSLAKLIKERPLTPDEVRRLRDRCALGLAAAHDKGIYHRDISPDNIILVEGKTEFAKIIDFGIAKSADPGDRTVIGHDFAGKYSYVSPEQLGAYGGQVDGRSDIYSLGLVLVAAAQGRALDMGNSPISVIEKRQRVPDLSAVPAELRDELAPLLQPDPKDRPQSMRDLAMRNLA